MPKPTRLNSKPSCPSTLRRVIALTAYVALAAQPAIVNAALGDNATDAVIGQPNAVTTTPNSGGVVKASTLAIPFGSAFDAAGRLYVADSGNNRVLIYNSPMATDHLADYVVGQPDFNSSSENNGGVSATSLAVPMGVAVDKRGNLWVADWGNHRVLEYDSPLTTDLVADRVFGQPDFVSSSPNNPSLSAASLNRPAGVTVDDAGNLWVGDNYNNRVVMYNDPIATADRIADLVIGQPDFTSNAPGTSATALYGPWGLTIDSKRNLWVADVINSRVLEFDDPRTFGTAADRVLGQPSLLTMAPNYTGMVDGSGLSNPQGVALDRNGNAYVADMGNNRVLFYRAPLALSDRVADYAFGQPDLNSNAVNNGGTPASNLAQPFGVAASPTGDVAMCDTINSRVLYLRTPVPIVTSIAVKVSPTTGRAKLIIQGYGMLAGSVTVSVDGTPLSTVKYKLIASDGTARKIIATDPSFDTIVQSGVAVEVTVTNTTTGSASAPIPFTR
jgi:sugar lactone lactonase YvrE